jgi:hypothetical protein
MGPAERAGRIFGPSDLAELHLQGIVNQETVGDRLTDAENFFNRFGGLENAHRTGQHTEDVLRSVLGYDDNQISSARDGGAFGADAEVVPPAQGRI